MFRCEFVCCFCSIAMSPSSPTRFYFPRVQISAVKHNVYIFAGEHKTTWVGHSRTYVLVPPWIRVVIYYNIFFYMYKYIYIYIIFSLFELQIGFIFHVYLFMRCVDFAAKLNNFSLHNFNHYRMGCRVCRVRVWLNATSIDQLVLLILIFLCKSRSKYFLSRHFAKSEPKSAKKYDEETYERIKIVLYCTVVSLHQTRVKCPDEWPLRHRTDVTHSTECTRNSKWEVNFFYNEFESTRLNRKENDTLTHML